MQIQLYDHFRGHILLQSNLTDRNEVVKIMEICAEQLNLQISQLV